MLQEVLIDEQNLTASGKVTLQVIARDFDSTERLEVFNQPM